MPSIYVSLIAYILGVVLSATVPYVLAWLEDPVPFDWRYLIGRIVGPIAALFAAGIFTPEFFETLAAKIAGLGSVELFFVSLGAGWGWSQVGRIGQKGIAVARKR